MSMLPFMIESSEEAGFVACLRAKSPVVLIDDGEEETPSILISGWATAAEGFSGMPVVVGFISGNVVAAPVAVSGSPVTWPFMCSLDVAFGSLAGSALASAALASAVWFSASSVLSIHSSISDWAISTSAVRSEYALQFGH